jgi:hypothetical protein
MKLNFGDYLPKQEQPNGWQIASGTRGLSSTNTGDAYQPPGRRQNPLGTISQRRFFVEKPPKKVEKKPLTDADFPSLGGDSSVPLTSSNPNWGAHLSKKATPKKDTLEVGWRDLTKPPTHEERSRLLFIQKLSKADDADAEWRQQYQEMYPHDTGDDDWESSTSSPGKDEDWEDPQAGLYSATEQKYPSRRGDW